MQYTMNYNSREYERTIRNRKRALQRKREVRRHILMIICGISLLLILTFFHKSITTNAADLESKTYCKYYQSIMIEEGDSLWSYAKEYADDIHYESSLDYIEEVRFINHLESDDTLITGNYIVIPYYAEVQVNLVQK